MSPNDPHPADTPIEPECSEIGTVPAGGANTSDSGPQTVATADAEELPRPEIPGYDVLEVLGRGGMGIVYKAIDRQLGRHVAIKMVAAGPMITESARGRFQSEARAVAVLQHPHIAQVYRAETIERRPYFVMEFIDGGPLSARIAGEPQPPRYAAELVAKLADAIQFSHEKNVLHRDLKPGNVLLTQAGEPKVADFGLAKFLDGDDSSTKTGEILGTPGYMSPEQAGGVVKNIGAGSDIYSLGAILYELLTGRPPFRTPDPLRTVLMVISEDPVPPRTLQPTVPKDLETICLKCLEKSPAKRYPTAGELSADLRRFLAGEPIQARPVGRIERAAKWVRRRPALATLIGVVGIGIVTAFAATVYHTRQIEQALEATATERDRNKRLSNQGQKLARFLITDLSPMLENLPGGSKPREQLAAELAAYLNQLEKDAEGNAELLTYLADAYQEVASVQGSPYGNNRGATTESLKNYRKALALRTQLARAAPGEVLPQLRLYRCRAQIADVEFQLGKIAAATREYREIAAALEKLRTRHPRDDRILEEILEMYARLGDTLEAEDNIPRALAMYEKSLKRTDEFTGTSAANRRGHAAIRNRIHFRIGQLLEKLRRIDDAEKYFLRVYEYCKEDLKRQPADVASRNVISSVLVALGDISSNRKQLVEARTYYRQALTIRRQAARDDPYSDKPQVDLAVVLGRLGLSYASDVSLKPTERARRGGAFQKEAVRILQNLVTQRGENVEYLRKLAIVQRHLGELLAPTPEISAGEQAFRDCIVTAGKLKRLQKGSLLADELTAESLGGLAKVEFSSGETAFLNKNYPSAQTHFAESLRLMRQSVAIWNSYHERNPDSPRTRALEKSAILILKFIEDAVKKRNGGAKPKPAAKTSQEGQR